MVAFSIFGVSIYWYGIFYAIAFLFAYFFLSFIIKRGIFRTILPGLHDLLLTSLDDIFLYSVVGVLVGGRLGHIFIYDFAHYVHNPLEIFMVWNGGMSFIGGIIGVVSVLSFFVWKHKIHIRDFLALGDLIFIPTAFGIMLGRVGNFLNQELYGIPVNPSFIEQHSGISYWFSHLGIFHIYPHIDQILRINTNLLSSCFEGGILFILFLFLFYKFTQKNRRSPGLFVGIFFVWYSSVRFLFEYIRADSQLEFIGWFTKSQRFFLVFALLGIIFLIFRKRLVNTKG